MTRFRRRLWHDRQTGVHLIHALAQTEVKELTYVANNVGEVGLGGGRLLRNGQIKKAIGSFFTSNREAVAAIEFELLPQGSLAEAIRAGGAGIGSLYTNRRRYRPGRRAGDQGDQRQIIRLPTGPAWQCRFGPGKPTRPAT